MKNAKRFNLPSGCELVTVGDLFDRNRRGEVWEFYLSSGLDSSDAPGRSSMAWATPYRTDVLDPQRGGQSMLLTLLGQAAAGLIVVARKVDHQPVPLIDVLAEVDQ